MLLANSSELLRLASDCERLYIFYGKLCPELLTICCKAFCNVFYYFCKFQQTAESEINNQETSFEKSHEISPLSANPTNW